MNEETKGELVTPNKERSLAAPVVSDSGSMLGMIGQMASTPECDIDKVERLMKIQLQMQDRENEEAFNAAMSAAQSEMGVIVKNKDNDQTDSRYADLGAIVKAITPVYTSQGINMSFDSGKAEEGIIPIVCYVSACGHTRTYHYDSPITDKGIKGTVMMTPAHARGSAISYGRRYLTCMIFNIATGDDDDGNAAGAAEIERISPKQVADLKALIEEVGAHEERFLKWLKTDSLENIQASAYDTCVKQLERMRKQ